VSLSRYAARRDQNEHGLVVLLRQLGASWVPLSIHGGPDGMIGWQNTWTHLAEIKRPGQKLRQSQLDWAADWHGAPVHVLRTAEDVYRLLRITT
jgi:hypothetical protein